MFVIFFALWLIFNARFTLEICIFGIVLSALMYLGRVGCLTFMLSLRTPSTPAAALPLEKVRIG